MGVDIMIEHFVLHALWAYWWKMSVHCENFHLPSQACQYLYDWHKIDVCCRKNKHCWTWKITWPMKRSCKVYMPRDNINMPRACGHALCQALFWILGYLQCVMTLCDRWEFYPIFQSSKMPAVITGCAVRLWDSLCCLVTQDCLWPNCID